MDPVLLKWVGESLTKGTDFPDADSATVVFK